MLWRFAEALREIVVAILQDVRLKKYASSPWSRRVEGAIRSTRSNFPFCLDRRNQPPPPTFPSKGNERSSKTEDPAGWLGG